MRACGEAIRGTQRYVEARFSTIAVYHPPVFLAVEDDRVSTIIVCLPGYYRGSQYVFLISIFRASGEAILGTQRYLEARFSTIAVYHPPVFFAARGG